ncbi:MULTISPECIES: hypothetical protein [unclassified Nostoc]|uniref:hypothetical protein n=1 Tax=unclassified Nostoc TaxID=2593658 RepID=UPI001E3B6C64|nr:MULTISPECIES: hypothetical protein [unclassified Nostoc]MCC5618906.1 hypothetical protein [Nostoc sp. CHAB 5836]MCC5621590.1 hypothetical protein [Nostoc sp. CHAB 5715]
MMTHSAPGTPSSSHADHAWRPVLERVKTLAHQSELFGRVEFLEGGAILSCEAPAAAAPAFYRVFAENGKLWVSLVTPDRYLSQSVEQDLVHTGDKLGDLIQDELIDVEHPAPYRPVVEHFRDPMKLFTFRSAVPASDLTGTVDENARRVWLTLKAYQACFVNLGDIEADDDE